MDLGSLSWTALRQRLDENPLDVIVPLGALEQHGPHLPLDTDSRIAAALADRAAERAGDCVVAPCQTVGASAHHLAFPGTASLTRPTLTNVLVELTRTLLSHGLRSAYIVTGHAGNVGAMAEASKSLDSEFSNRVVAFDNWPAQRDAVHRVAELHCGLDRATCGTHAGHFETSILLAIAPETVEMAAAVAGHIGEPETASDILREKGMHALSPVGIIGDPRHADAAAGHLYLEALTDLVVSGIATHRAGHL